MKHLCCRVAVMALVAACVGGGWSPAMAQQPRYQRPVPTIDPPYSPYLNLLRRGNPTFLNYYGLVRPEQRFRQSIQGLQQQVDAVSLQNAAVSQQLDQALPATGHPTRFLNYSHYFGNQGGGGSVARPSGAARTSVTPTGSFGSSRLGPGLLGSTPRPAGGR